VSAVVDGGGGLGHVPAHFGAAGFYTLMAANAGLVGMACTSASGIQVAPTFGKQARLGTRNKANEKLPAPDGWLPDREGRPSNDPLVAREKGGFLTSLGGSPENSSYKGYGLAVMVNILASCLSGCSGCARAYLGRSQQQMNRNQWA
jgi:LDH2 family malate/lactate/ureidoglycolate dehydrogenase